MQLNAMNTRVVALVAQDPSRWALAGDQLFVDLDLKVIAAGRIRVGDVARKACPATDARDM
jgi:hypothetical protein